MARRPFMFRGNFFKITASCGISCFPHDGENAAQLVKKADEAMYYSKHHGRNTTTQAGMIKFLKTRNTFLTLLILCIISMQLFISYQYYLKYPIRRTIETVRAVRVSVSPINSDTITFIDGLVLNGKILKETNKKLIFNIYEDNGRITQMIFNKSEIKEIVYGTKTGSRKRYREYIEDNPNPHRD